MISMTRCLVSCIMLLIVTPFYAQKKNFDYDFYGFVRGDLYSNSRQNEEVVDGLFYLLPKPEVFDANGKDLNATPNSNFYVLTTRLGLDLKGPDIGSARSSAKIETDFGGMSGVFFVLRIRHAYTKLDWDNGSSVLLGQTWHPFFGDVAPQILGLSTGAPFQPFSRSPQLRYTYTKNNWEVKATALYQAIYQSSGPDGKSKDYLKNGIWPELCLNLDYRHGGLLVGLGAEMLSLKPRLQSMVGGQIYRVDERITTFSYEAHARYVHGLFTVAGKTLLASNMNHTALVGGYGISKIDPANGEQQYTPFRHSTTWVNAVYGSRWQGGLFGGYTKNLGTSKALVDGAPVYGLGMDLDQLLTVSGQLSYNLPHWKIGLEYLNSTGWYGEIHPANGKVRNASDVMNHRILGLFTYYF